jgi:hypothetical protein
MTSSVRRCAGWLAGVLTLAAVTLVAQAPPAQAPAPAPPSAAAPRAEEPPKNLQVLPKDLTRRQVIDIMRGFTAALDVQCTHCHYAKDPKDFSTIDFASDEKEEKKTARVMLRMVKTINDEYVSKVAMPSSPEVRCFTCHHGQTRPRTLEDSLAPALAEGGAKQALARYAELREKYYGRAVYDFGPDTLARMGQSLAREQKLADALAILEFNAQQYPDSARTLAVLADVQAASGNREGAIATLKKLLALEPDDARTKQRLEELSKPPSE